MYDADYIPASAMAIYAHPDDAEFTVAGTIARWAQGGCEVTLVAITSGNSGTHDTRFTRETLARTREEEALASARVLGISRVVFLGYGDCELVPTMVTASPDEASGHMESEGQVFSTPIPPEVYLQIEAVVVEHHRPQEKKVRRRKKWTRGDKE